MVEYGLWRHTHTQTHTPTHTPTSRTHTIMKMADGQACRCQRPCVTCPAQHVSTPYQVHTGQGAACSPPVIQTNCLQACEPRTPSQQADSQTSSSNLEKPAMTPSLCLQIPSVIHDMGVSLSPSRPNGATAFITCNIQQMLQFPECLLRSIASCRKHTLTALCVSLTLAS